MDTPTEGRPAELVGIPVKDFTPEQRKLYGRWQWAKHGEQEKERRKTLGWVKEKRREYMRTYKRLRMQRDPVFRLLNKLRVRLSHAISKNRKTSPIEPLIGCSVTKLRHHFESLFEPGMTWQNYASIWQIDHIQPVVTFNLLNPKQLAKCFHYTNLRPRLVHLNGKESRVEG
jgi:hypothetical protein